MTRTLPIYDRDITLVKGKGSRLWDKDGREWLDFAAGIAVNGFGYGDRKIVAAIKKQAETLIHASNLFHTEPGSALAERLVKLAFPSKVFFTNSGTEAWEGAMKFARRIGKEQGRTEYVCFEHAFHGRSDGLPLDHLDRQVPGALRAARARRALRPAERPRGGGRGREREDRGGDDRAGAGRGRHPARDAGVPEGPRGDLPGAGRAPRLRRDPVRPRPHREDVRVPALGRRAGHPHPGQAPRRRAAHGRRPAQESLAGFLKVGDHGTTFGGNPVCAAAALAVLDHLEEPGFLDDIGARGLYLVRGLKKLGRKYKGQVAEVRGLGLMIGVEFRGEAAPVLKGLKEKGILAVKAGDKVLRLLPPLVVKRGEIRQLARRPRRGAGDRRRLTGMINAVIPTSFVRDWIAPRNDRPRV